MTKPAAITEIPLSPERDRRTRMIRYAIAMSIRVVCIALCLVTPGWWLLIPAAGAIFLPYVAVVVANNVHREVDAGRASRLDRAPRRRVAVVIGFGETDARCSSTGCRAAPAYRVNWRNPRIHSVDRVKVWLACAEHRDHLAGLPREPWFPGARERR